MSQASDQITEYLSVGGLFNPEIMNQTQHEAVRDTLIKARDDIQQLERENAALRELIGTLGAPNHVGVPVEQWQAMRADKARLDWLDKTGCWLTVPGSRKGQKFFAGTARNVIDSEMGVASDTSDTNQS